MGLDRVSVAGNENWGLDWKMGFCKEDGGCFAGAVSFATRPLNLLFWGSSRDRCYLSHEVL